MIKMMQSQSMQIMLPISNQATSIRLSMNRALTNKKWTAKSRWLPSVTNRRAAQTTLRTLKTSSKLVQLIHPWNNSWALPVTTVRLKNCSGTQREATSRTTKSSKWNSNPNPKKETSPKTPSKHTLRASKKRTKQMRSNFLSWTTIYLCVPEITRSTCSSTGYACTTSSPSR